MTYIKFMPVKYRIKEYQDGGHYHIYNRGIDNREVFAEEGDYIKYLEVLEGYVTQKDEKEDTIYKSDRPSVAAKKREMNLEGEVEVVAYCLLPDHFHLLVKQSDRSGITKLMRRLNTAYVMYFNSKYHRHGPLFETVYRAGLVAPESILELTKYIHIHPVTRTTRRFGPVMTVSAGRPEDYMYSSYRQYIGIVNDIWVSNGLLNMSPKQYIKFMQQPQVAEKLAAEVPLFD